MNVRKFLEDYRPEIEEFDKISPLQERVGNVEQIFNKIESDCQGDDQLVKQYSEVVKNCYRYLAIVCEFVSFFYDYNNGRFSKDEYENGFKEIDDRRTSVHNVTIDSFNILSRMMKSKERDNGWVQPLVQGGRVAYGQLAMNKTFVDILKIQQENEDGDDGQRKTTSAD